MDDFILQAQPDWRYCRVRDGDKRPLDRDWPTRWLTLDQVDTESIGLLLGPASGGIVAVDFDGPTAIEYAADKGFDFRNFPLTPTWSSGREGRFQSAFSVAKELWDTVETAKFQTRPQSRPGVRDGEGIEFRWRGAQSVLPPSRHPETGQPYEWWTAALESVKPIPEALWHIWQDLIKQATRETQRREIVDEVRIDNLQESDIMELNLLLGTIRTRLGSLNYDQWIRVSWAVAHRVGRAAAAELMKDHFPEQRPGEYQDLFRDWRTERTPKMGTLYHMAGWTKKTATEITSLLWQIDQQRQREEIRKLEQKVKQLRKGNGNGENR